MNKSFRSFLSVFVVATIYYLLSSCANIGIIEGGDRDSIAPVMLGSNPILLDTGFNDKKVYILFNEIIALKDINQEFYSSPPFEEVPNFKVKKHGLIIKFKEPLKDSVTYTLNFNNGVADNNEGNILKKFRFIFSTKSNIDSFSISGNLRNAIDQSAPEKSTVMIFENHEDSIPYKSLGSYICRTDSSGDFNIDFIRQGSYKIFALIDKNNNKLADFFEDRAFLDSLIVPQRASYITIDSIKAGTILHDLTSGRTDSLVNDTVIISHKSDNSPSNLRLYLFQEENFVQKMLDYERKERGKITIAFTLPITPDFMVSPMNFQVSPEKVIIEKSLKNDTITWWVTDTLIQAMDSLEVNISYQSLDTLGNPVVVIDTVVFEYREKQVREVKKKKGQEVALKKEYLKLNYLIKDNKLDLNKPIRIESPEPILAVDTSKIRLFEIVDTSTIDTKEQKIIKALRIEKDLLSFTFQRPIAEEFYLIPINFKSEKWYTYAAKDSNRTYTCRITDPEVALMDTLKLRVDFDNFFFMDQIQVLSDTSILPISPNKLLSRKRNEADKITLVFDKPVSSDLLISPIDFSATPNWYTISKNSGQDTVSINITDQSVIDKDTLTFSVKCFDYFGLQNDSVYFNETMRVTYKEIRQYLVSASRLKKEELKLYFNKKLIENPILEPLNFSSNAQWFQFEKNKDGDSLTVKITEKSVASKDTITILLKYREIGRKGQSLENTDTLKMINGKINQYGIKTESKLANELNTKPQIVHIYLPTPFSFESDSINIRQRILNSEWKEETKYILRLDSMVFVSVFNSFNEPKDVEFSTKALDFYSTVLLKLKQIKPNVQSIISETAEQDSLTRDKISKPFIIPQKDIDELIGQGEIIVQLLSDKNAIVREYFISKDQDIKMDFLNPGNYRIKIIFDRNGNGKWDTGDYFKHIQPERVIMSGDDTILKSGDELELEWNVGESLINTFTKQISKEYVGEDAE